LEYSPIKGQAGNIEYLIYLEKTEERGKVNSSATNENQIRILIQNTIANTKNIM